MRGEELFLEKQTVPVAIHRPTARMADARFEAEGFYKAKMEGGMLMTADGPIKSFPLRGVKESPPYLHDGRCLTLEDVVEFFNLIGQLNLSATEKKDLVAFLRVL